MPRNDVTRALVLGGGGVTGMGWQAGVLAGLLDEGIDLRNADTVIGTSAGAFTGANYLSDANWQAAQSDWALAADREPAVRSDPSVYEAWAEAFRVGAGDPHVVGAALGRLARGAVPTVDAQTRQRVVRTRLRTTRWPSTLRVTVTDAVTGRLELVGPDAGVELNIAAAASGAVPGLYPTVEFGGREWIDAGMVSAANASLAAGHDRIVVLAPMHEGHGGIPSAGDDVDRLSQQARASLVIPDGGSRNAIGPNPYDPHRAEASAAAGRRQGRLEAARIRDVWS